MDLSFTPAQEAFREEVRRWIAEALPPHLAAKAAVDGNFSMDEVMEWHRILYAKGWIAPHWPKEHGGPGWDAATRFIFSEELERAGTPQLSPFGLSMVGPLIIQFGTEAQKKRFLPKILSGEEVWCQGYSEPNAGSDLASLRTEARDEGDHFVVNGQKTWTTYAQYADWIFCLVRTDASGKKQHGISFLLIDMKTPGVEVKPMLTSGHTPAFCDTFFDNVKVPKENVVGRIHEGWTMAKALLGHERTLIAAVGQSTRAIHRVKRIAAQTEKDGRPLLEDPQLRAKIARLEIDLEALKMANFRALAGAQLGQAPGPESSILKLRGSEILQRALELAMDAMGQNAISWSHGAEERHGGADASPQSWRSSDPSTSTPQARAVNEEGVVPALEQWVPSSFNYTRATTIYGGSNEIQKNIIAKMILGLPEIGKA